MNVVNCEVCGKDPTDSPWRNVGFRGGYRMIKLGCPFICPKCNVFRFGMKAIRDIVLIWPIPLSEKFLEDGVIVRTDRAVDVKDEIYGRSDYGIVLSSGPGFYHYGRKKFISTGDQLYVGAKVLYDRHVPWRTEHVGCDGKLHLVVICGYFDVEGVLEDD